MTPKSVQDATTPRYSVTLTSTGRDVSRSVPAYDDLDALRYLIELADRTAADNGRAGAADCVVWEHRGHLRVAVASFTHDGGWQ